MGSNIFLDDYYEADVNELRGVVQAILMKIIEQIVQIIIYDFFFFLMELSGLILFMCATFKTFNCLEPLK